MTSLVESTVTASGKRAYVFTPSSAQKAQLPFKMLPIAQCKGHKTGSARTSGEARTGGLQRSGTVLG